MVFFVTNLLPVGGVRESGNQGAPFWAILSVYPFWVCFWAIRSSYISWLSFLSILSGYAWRVPVVCLVCPACAWGVSGVCLGCAWRVPGVCLTPTCCQNRSKIDQKSMPRCIVFWDSFFDRFLVDFCSQLGLIGSQKTC